MRLVRHTIWIARPREAVFDFFTDFSQAAWRSYVTSLELIDPPPLRAGSRIRGVLQLNGQPYHTVMTVLTCERPSVWRHKTNQKDYDGAVEYRFDSEGEGTRVTMIITARPITTYGWLGLPLLWLSRGRSYPDQLASLKRAVEGPG